MPEVSKGVRAAAREIARGLEVRYFVTDSAKISRNFEQFVQDLAGYIERHTHAGEMRTFIDNLASGDCQQCYAPERARVLILALDADKEEGR